MGKWAAALRCFTAARQTKKPVTSEVLRVSNTASWSVRASCYARTVVLGLTADTCSVLTQATTQSLLPMCAIPSSEPYPTNQDETTLSTVSSPGCLFGAYPLPVPLGFSKLPLQQTLKIRV